MTAPTLHDQIAGTLPKRTGRPRTAECGTRSKYTMGCRCTACTDANTEYQRDYAARNPTARARHAETSARWARENRDRVRATDQAWRERNREHIRKQAREYYAANPEARRAAAARGRAREQARTIRSSINHQLPWSAADDRRLRDLWPTMTAGQVGVALGRTSFGVRNRVKKLGLTKAGS